MLKLTKNWSQYWQYNLIVVFEASYMETESISDIEETFTEHNIQNAVFVFGQALLNIHKKECQGQMTLCEGMADILKNGYKMLQTLKKVKGILYRHCLPWIFNRLSLAVIIFSNV